MCVINFTAGFYTIEVDEKSQPYLCIYTEGRGFQCYQRMPMGTLGSLACFAVLTVQAFKDLVVELGLETFMDNNGIAGDEFDELLQWLRKFLIQCRERGLSLSPSKLQLFMPEVIFRGSRVKKEGIKPDIVKLEAVAKWPQPANLLDLMHFLGLTGYYFRSLIKDYARIVAPLTDLQRNLDMPQPSVKAGRRRYHRPQARCILDHVTRQSVHKTQTGAHVGPCAPSTKVRRHAICAHYRRLQRRIQCSTIARIHNYTGQRRHGYKTTPNWVRI